MSGLMWLYRHPVGLVMISNLHCAALQNPNVADAIAAGFSFAIPSQSTFCHGT